MIELKDQRRGKFRGIAKGFGFGCGALCAALVIAILLLLRWLVAPGNVPSAERFITPDCKGFLIVRIRPDDSGVKAFLENREAKFQQELQSDKLKRPPWIFRQVFGETPAQMWKKFMPLQMVWTIGREPGKDKPDALCVFSTSRGKGMFSLFHKQLLRSAQGVEPGGEYKGKKIVMLKDAPPPKPSSEGTPEKGEKESSPDQPKPEEQPPLLDLPRPTAYPWVACFDTTLLEASTLEGLKRGIDLATAPEAGFAGLGYIKTAYEGFSMDMEVIGAVSDEADLAGSVVATLLSFIGGEKPKDVRARIQWQEIQSLNGCVDIAGADRAHVSVTITCADEKSAQALHSALAAEFGMLRDNKRIEALSHTKDGATTTIEFDVGDLDNLPRKEEEPEEETKGKDVNEPADTQPDSDH